MKYCFGVDIGGTTVKMGLFSTTGDLYEKWEIKTRTENEGRQVLPDIAASVRSKMEEKGISIEDMAGVGIGVPAPVSEEGIVKNSANIGWGYKNVKKRWRSCCRASAPGSEMTPMWRPLARCGWEQVKAAVI